MEMWDVIDEEGNKTGKVVGKYQVPEGYYHLGADVWIVNSKNEILLQKRPATKSKSPNCWAMTGGSVIVGETSKTTIVRETKEELGIDISNENLELFTKIKTGDVIVDTYFLKKDVNIEDMELQKEEVEQAKWVTYEEAEKIFNDGQFIKNRWEFVRDFIKTKIV